MNTSRINYILAFVVALAAIFPVLGVKAQSADPIPGYLVQISQANLTNVATNLVTLYGPRRWNTFSPYFSDGSCTQNGSIVYPKSTYAMSVDYVKGLFEAMGYPPSSITLETVPQNAGQNIYVTKVGSVYPNTLIEFGAHLDSVPGSPGGNDNASGSTAVIELARVLKDYPSRYSMRFILFAAEEYDNQWGAAYFGSNYHVQQALARGEQIKAALIMDHIGWHYPSDPTGYFNEISFIDTESERIADMFNQVRADYGIGIGFGKDQGLQNSDEHSYWAYSQVAVSSGGGWLYYKPNYHGCGDTALNINFTNVLRVAQQNLAVGLRLDADAPGGSTPTVTSTVTPGPSPTRTNTPLPPTATLPPAPFPSTGILDNFNRSNGVIGGNWSGNTAGYSIVSNQLDVGSSEDIYWSAASFGVEQEAFVTMTTIDPNASEIGLILKAQSSNGLGQGLIDVLYAPLAQQIQVWTYHASQGWIRYGSNLPATFVNGDQLGVRAKANGQVEVYRNSSLLGVWDVSGWPYYASTGFIGLFNINAVNLVLDDFGGGTAGASPTPTPTNTLVLPTATHTPTFASTNTPIPPTATSTRTSTPTFTAIFTPTSTPVPATSTFTPTSTATSTLTATALPPTATFTQINTATNTPTSTATFTSTSVPVSTDTATLTSTPAPPTETHTPTNTSTFTPTNTSVPPTATFTLTNASTFTPTNTAAFTPTNTPVPPTATNSSGFPVTGILDNFNRSNGAIGSNWSGNTGGYSIVSNQLDVGLSEDIYWDVSSFGPDQEAYIKLTTIDPNAWEIGLTLKAQSSTGLGAGLIDVLYIPSTQQVQIWTYHLPNGWVQRGTNIPITFANGDQFGVRAKANGQVEIYRNGNLVGVRDVSAWPYYAGSGYIGLFNINAGNAVLDDFGGGTVNASSTSTPTFTNTPIPPTFTPTNTPIPPTATFTPTSTSLFTSTYTATSTVTNTPAPPSGTFTPTNTVTSTLTNTPLPPTATHTPTHTPAPFTNTGFLPPSAHASQTSNAGDNNGYETNPTNAFVDDGLVATDLNSGTNTNTSCTNNGKDKHLFQNFNFNLPSSAVIQGIQVRLDARADSASNTPRMCVQISWDGGVTWTAAQQTSTLGTTEATYTLGSISNTWGRIWNASDFSNANFRIRVINVAGSTARDFYLDYLAVNVTYRP